jgi:hypothetical protein
MPSTNSNRDSSVGIVTGYGLDDPVSIPSIARFFLFTASRPTLGSTQPPIQWVAGALTPGVKRPGREADHPHLVPSQEWWSYTSTPSLCF